MADKQMRPRQEPGPPARREGSRGVVTPGRRSERNDRRGACIYADAMPFVLFLPYVAVGGFTRYSVTREAVHGRNDTAA